LAELKFVNISLFIKFPLIRLNLIIISSYIKI